MPEIVPAEVGPKVASCPIAVFDLLPLPKTHLLKKTVEISTDDVIRIEGLALRCAKDQAVLGLSPADREPQEFPLQGWGEIDFPLGFLRFGFDKSWASGGFFKILSTAEK